MKIQYTFKYYTVKKILLLFAILAQLGPDIAQGKVTISSAKKYDCNLFQLSYGKKANH